MLELCREIKNPIFSQQSTMLFVKSVDPKSASLIHRTLKKGKLHGDFLIYNILMGEVRREYIPMAYMRKGKNVYCRETHIRSM